ncbi:DUF1579 domain-containing protein [Marilutibacter aestuarii]|uniref:DUF1579 domain-containing protein n=1 Tax=Marilutibacter aestuarii TaxID=1706195 RepID=A0A508AEA9_9GAMM|nr:DUF1579 domain-containing protein [Lysobacter aestuarii]TQD47717.1 DUF1579 domain-containing protein [Lysobacter aestuarii]
MTSPVHHAVLLACTLAVAPLVNAQEAASDPTAAMSPEQQAMMAAWEKASRPGPEHARLAEHFVGRWDARQTLWMAPDAPPMTATGQAQTTAEFGGRQMRMAYAGEMMGAPFEGASHTGYDNVSGVYTSVWMDNMSTGTYTMTGRYDAASRTYTFTGEWPDPMAAGKMLPVRETLRIVDADHHVMDMYETHGGEERHTMRIEFSRAE